MLALATKPLRQKGFVMCLTCGCGRPEDQHDSEDNIVLADLKRAANAADITPDEALKNMNTTMASAS